MYISRATKACALYEEERGEDGRIMGLRKTEEYALGEEKKKLRRKNKGGTDGEEKAKK